MIYEQKMGTILGSNVSAKSANQLGELVTDVTTNELLHYTEKPETFRHICTKERKS